MEVKIIEIAHKKFTRFKISNKDIKYLPNDLIKALGEPTKKSSRFTYYEVEGDLLNK